MAGIVPTYLPQVQQDHADSPTGARAHPMATFLGANADEWTALAGRVPEDLPGIIQRHLTVIPELLWEASGLTAEQMRILGEQDRKLKESH
jgi:hypothetical protein